MNNTTQHPLEGMPLSRMLVCILATDNYLVYRVNVFLPRNASGLKDEQFHLDGLVCVLQGKVKRHAKTKSKENTRDNTASGGNDPQAMVKR